MKHILFIVICLTTISISFGQDRQNAVHKPEKSITDLANAFNNSSMVFEQDYNDDILNAVTANKLYFISSINGYHYFTGYYPRIPENEKFIFIKKFFDNDIFTIHGHNVPEDLYWFKVKASKNLKSIHDLIETTLTNHKH